MSMLRTAMLAGVVTALVRCALAMPAAAADTKGTLAIVNGVPGTKVDACIDGKEIRSKLPYGGKVFLDETSTGKKKLTLYQQDARRCKGRKLGQRSLTLDPAEDLTIGVTK